jgi:hypothetical protein
VVCRQPWFRGFASITLFSTLLALPHFKRERFLCSSADVDNAIDKGWDLIGFFGPGKLAAAPVNKAVAALLRNGSEVL